MICLRDANLNTGLVSICKSDQLTEIKLSAWSKDNYFLKPQSCTNVLNGLEPGFKDTIERVHVDNITKEEFFEKYEKPGKPVII